MLQQELGKFAAVELGSAEGVAEKLAVEEQQEPVEEAEKVELSQPYEAETEQQEPGVDLGIGAASAAAQLSTSVAQSTVVASAVQSTAFEIRADKVEVVDHLQYPEHNKVRYTRVSKIPASTLAFEARYTKYIENAE